MAEAFDNNEELKELTDEQFEDTSFWSNMLDEPDDPSFVERSDRTEGFLDDDELPVQTENLQKDDIPQATPQEDQSLASPKRKLILIALIALVLLSTAGAVTYFVSGFFGSSSITKEEEEEKQENTITQEGEAIPTKEVEHYSTAWEPFWLRLQKDGKEHFVTLSFTTLTTTQKVMQEIQHKEILLRDAVYYYLQNITLQNNKETIEKIKKDIVEILNSYITSGSIENLGIETFFVQ